MKRLISFILVLILLMAGLAGQAFANPFPVSHVTYETTYDAIIKMYIRVLDAGGSDGKHHDLFNPKIISFECDRAAMTSLPRGEQKKLAKEIKQNNGFRIFDINGDGVDELIISSIYGEIFEIFTVDNECVRELARAWFKKECNLLDDGNIHSYTHGDGSYIIHSIWKLNGTADLTFVEGYQYDSFADSFIRNGLEGDARFDYLWFRMQSGEDKVSSDDTLIPTDDFFRWLDETERRKVKPAIIPFAAFEQGITSENVGIISVKGKMNGKDKVKIRKEPSKKAKVLKNAATGTYVNILGEEDEFYKVGFDGKEGYVLKEFLTSLEEIVSTYESNAVISNAGQNVVNPETGYSNSESVSVSPNSLESSAFNVLKPGSKGEEVMRLQGRLHDLGYFAGEIDGTYNDMTMSAVREFQSVNGLAQTGLFDEFTYSFLYSSGAKAKPSNDFIEANAKIVEVKNLQGRLYHLGYYTGEVDGIYDESTTSAVREFQRVNGLSETGIFDEKTSEVFYSGSARPKSNDDSAEDSPSYLGVIDHYEEVEVRRAVEVYDHDEYVLEDNGEGQFVEVAHPVYRTEYITEIVHQPVYVKPEQ